MRELVFSVKDIFNSETASGCLSQYETLFYHIPAYQRGYKWGVGKSGAVTLLLEDLWDAYIQQKNEYYLQYITVKPIQIDVKGKCLEVIDGQQRITTLSILLSAFAALIPCENIASDKLDYAIRENLFEEQIYPADAFLKFSEQDWDGFIKEDPVKFDRQDIYYLHQAAKECLRFLKNTVKAQELTNFYKFICESVKVIVNSIELHISSETVFKNLNSNRVPLSETELIKALLITHAGREEVHQAEYHFRQVMEVRVSLGRAWDDVQCWANDAAIKSFFFNDSKDPMFDLLSLTVSLLEKSSPSILSIPSDLNGKHLFSFFNKHELKKEALNLLTEIKHRLEDWFNKDEIYHLIGFCRFSKGSKYKNLQFIKQCLDASAHSELISFLNSKKHNLIFGSNQDKPPKDVIADLRYGEDSNQIHAILLALSVFPPDIISRRFDFKSFESECWSLEHIFPQTPEGKKNELDDNDKENIRTLFLESDIEISEELKEVLNKHIRTEDEKKLISEQLAKCELIHCIGNMCLLTGGSNSALGCGFFDVKRRKILQILHNGGFVPTHTFDVFSKMIKNLNSDIGRWCLADIRAHEAHIVEQLVPVKERI